MDKVIDTGASGENKENQDKSMDAEKLDQTVKERFHAKMEKMAEEHMNKLNITVEPEFNSAIDNIIAPKFLDAKKCDVITCVESCFVSLRFL